MASAAVAGFFLRRRPPREPRLVFFFAGWSAVVSAGVSSSVSASAVSSSLSASPVSSSAWASASGSGAGSACFLAGGLRVGYSAALSAVIGSSGAFLPPTSDA